MPKSAAIIPMGMNRERIFGKAMLGESKEERHSKQTKYRKARRALARANRKPKPVKQKAKKTASSAPASNGRANPTSGKKV